MKVTLGEEGLVKTHQDTFPKIQECCRCSGKSRIGFVAHEGFDNYDDQGMSVCDLHKNGGRGNFWLHDYCSVAVYFCKDCLQTTTLCNQG